MNYSTFMKAFWELAASILNKAKEKGFDILLLLGVVAGLIWYIQHNEQQWTISKAELKSDITRIGNDLNECNTAREKMAVDLARMTVRVEWLENKAK